MNDLSKVVDKLLAQGLLALRGTCVMPRLVNSDYSNLAAQQGASIDVPIPSAIKAQAVTPGATSQDTGDISPVSATIKLDRWMEAPFYLTDKDLMEANRGVIPMQASEAVKAIANDVNATLLGLGRKFYGMVGTPGTTPFSTVVDATNARKVLNRQLAPVNDRRIVLDPDAEAAALGLSGFADVSKSGDARPIIDGTIGRKYGFDWAMDQQVPTFEASVMTEGALTVNGANEAGAQVVSLAKATNAAGLKEGDILTIAGDAQTYVVTEAVSLAVGNTAVKIYPGLARATTGSEAVTVSGSHVMNLAFHRDAMTICDANGWRTDKAFISITHSDEKPGHPPRPCVLPEPFRQPCRGRHQHRARALHDPRFPRFDLHPADFPFLRRLRLLRLRFLLPDALPNRPAWLFLFQHSVPLM